MFEEGEGLRKNFRCISKYLKFFVGGGGIALIYLTIFRHNTSVFFLRPCILIFDSLSGASRARIIATLRDYLRIEYKVKHQEDRDFSKHVVKGACPRVPQQNNYTDCGLFVLQYVETFFEVSSQKLLLITVTNIVE